jgi:sporulation protein YlmC with PRC-barrel domain
MIRLADLYGVRVVDGAGRLQGRVREAHCAGGEITHLGIGPGTLLQRLKGGPGGRHIAWSAVTAISKGLIVIEGD